jgi:hypothetical protein
LTQFDQMSTLHSLSVALGAQLPVLVTLCFFRSIFVMVVRCALRKTGRAWALGSRFLSTAMAVRDVALVASCSWMLYCFCFARGHENPLSCGPLYKPRVQGLASAVGLMGVISTNGFLSSSFSLGVMLAVRATSSASVLLAVSTCVVVVSPRVPICFYHWLLLVIMAIMSVRIFVCDSEASVVIVCLALFVEITLCAIVTFCRNLKEFFRYKSTECTKKE